MLLLTGLKRLRNKLQHLSNLSLTMSKGRRPQSDSLGLALAKASVAVHIPSTHTQGLEAWAPYTISAV